MKMQDKELDDVFRSQLEGFEVEPSERVWTGIDEELNSGARRKIWIPVLRIVAVFVVMASVGVVFVLKRDKTIVIAHGHSNVAKTKVQPVVQPEKAGEQVTEVKPAVQRTAAKKNIEVPKKIEREIARGDAGHKDQSQVGKAEAPAIQSPVQEIVKPKEQEVMATVPAQIEIKQPVVPNIDVPLSKKILDAGTNLAPNKLAVTAQTAAVDSAKRPKHHGIHSFGDLVNVVAGKVDKKHAARMTDDDDDDSAVAMVNRGLQKLSADREK